MNRNPLAALVTGFLFLSAGLAVAADDNETQQPEPGNHSHTIVIESDGSITANGSLEKLPENVRKRIQLMMQKIEEVSGNDEEPKDHSVKLPQDDKKIEAIAMTNRRGVITFIGPDGTKTTTILSNGLSNQANGLSKAIRQALESNEGISHKVIDRVLGSINLIPQVLGEDIAEITETRDAKADSILDKLDAIASRLDRIEADVAELKAAK